MHDLRFACRQLAQSPGFTAVAVLTLALGIGACTAIFTVADGVLLRPIAYPESERLMVVHETFLPEYPEFSVSPANFRDYAGQADSFEGMAAIRDVGYSLTGEGEPVRLIAQRVTARYFELLRSPPALGRGFTADDDLAGKNAVVVLSHRLWQRRFGGRPDILNSTIRLDDQPHTVVGVMPPGFQRGGATELWAPMAFSDREAQQRGAHYLNMIGRLKPGVTSAQAQVQLETIARRLSAQYPDTNKNWGVRALPMLEYYTRGMRPALFTLLGAVGLLLLIACANLANLLLARATTRQRETAIRAALGAGRGRLLRQLLTESLVLAALGGGAGVLLAVGGLRVLLAFAPANLPRLAEVSLDAGVLAFTAGVALLTGLAFGLAPAWQSLRVNLVEALKDGARGGGAAARRHGLRGALVVAEIALALMLLAGAGLLLRSFGRLISTSPGFEPRGAVAIFIDLPRQAYGKPEKCNVFAEALLARFRALPGVTHAGLTHVLPFSGDDYILGLEIEGKPVPKSDLPSTNYFAATPGYFQAMGIPLLRGRDFTDADRTGSTRVVIVSQALAAAHFPGRDPLGQRISVTQGPQTWREIVGVAGDVKHYGIDAPTAPQTYEPFAQEPFPNLSFVVRTADPAAATTLAAALRREVRAVDPALPIARLEPLTGLVAGSLAQQRFALTLFGVFAGLALMLAAIGVYGVMACAVAQRTNEFGVRLALGAQPGDVLRLVAIHAARLVTLGLALGFAGTLAAGRLIASQLYLTSTRDPLVFAVIGLVLAAVAALACWLPARRATRVDPIIALRAE
jgi:putative ABC transport system permease protein